MKENLYIFCKSKNNTQPIQHIDVDNNTTIWIINPYNFAGVVHGRRYYNVFCDRTFMDSYSGRELIEEIFKDLAYNKFSLI